MIKIATIISANYWAYAKVLGNSLKEHGYHNFFVLIVDRKNDELLNLANETGFSYLFAEDLGILDFNRVSYKYDVVELNTALKPSFLKYLFDSETEQVIYFDPDIQVFDSLNPIINAHNNFEIVLTPHSIKSVMDGLRPSDVDFLKVGVFNLGFISLKNGKDTVDFLDWWESRCLGMGFNDISFGTFVDQKWIDLVPCYFNSVFVLKHAGCNVAYWNLHERNLTMNGAKVLVNGESLIFFHFSGVNANIPDRLSMHQTRHLLKTNNILKSLVNEYCKNLIAAGHDKYKKFVYTFGQLDDGSHINKAMRRAILVNGMDEINPFNSNSDFQKELRKSGLTSTNKNIKATNTLNFDETSIKVKILNTTMRCLNRIIGVEKMRALLQYCALLTREFHLESILLKKPFDFRHIIRK
jgi:hypothetical protein